MILYRGSNIEIKSARQERSVMSKTDMLIEYIVGDIVSYIIEDKNLKMGEAMAILYNSQIFEKLYDIETGLYLCGSAYVYELLKEEWEAAFIT